MAAPENIKAGFIKEQDAFAEAGIKYVTPFVSLDEPLLVPKQLFEGMRDGFPGLTYAETARAADAGFARFATSATASVRNRATCSSGARGRTARVSW